MKRSTYYIISVVGAALLYSTYRHFHRRKENKLAKQLIGQLQKLLNPASAGLLSEDGFDIYYLDKVRQQVRSGLIVLHEAVAIRYAQDIHDSFSFWGDDEQRIYSVFRSLKDKVQLSQVARAYHDKYKANLIDVLSDRLSESEVSTILQITASLPNYRTK